MEPEGPAARARGAPSARGGARRQAGAMLLAAACAACGGPDRRDAATATGSAPAPMPDSALVPPATAPRAADLRLIALGDSLTAGRGLAAEDAFPAVLARELALRGWDVDVVNAGVSGDTSAAGLARLDWLLRQEPDLLLVGLGANDGLLGLPPEATRENLRRIVERARAAGAQVLLLGMKLPPNYGEDYVGSFEAVYPRLAADLGVALVPFLLEGVAGRPELNFADGIHPNAEGQRRVAAHVLPYVEKALRALAAEAEAP